MRRSTSSDRRWLAMVAAILGIAYLAALSFAPRARASAGEPSVAAWRSTWPTGERNLAEASAVVPSTLGGATTYAYDAPRIERVSVPMEPDAESASSQALSGEDDAQETAAVPGHAAMAPRVLTYTPRGAPGGPGVIDDAVSSGPTPNLIGFADSPPAVVPTGSVGPTATRSPGFQFTGGSGGPGLDPRLTGVRVMDQTAHHGRRVVYMNETGQTVNPLTGRTVGKDDPWAHLPW